jgi:hypothetical protein
MWRRMVLNDQADVAQTATETPLVAGLVFAVPVLLAVSHGRTSGALRDVDLRPAEFDDQTDWRNAFFDGSVLVPEDRRDQIGQPCLWTWIAENPEPLSDKEFFGRWRGWLTLNPDWADRRWSDGFAPEEWRDVAPIPPPPDCTWDHPPLPASD